MEDDFHSYYNNKYDDDDDDFEEEEEEMEEEEEEEEDEGYPYPIGPMPQEIYNDLRSLDEMVSNYSRVWKVWTIEKVQAITPCFLVFTT